VLSGPNGAGGLTDARYRSATSLNLVLGITENLQLFGRATYRVYGVDEAAAPANNSEDGAWQFLFGIGGVF
jgi:hypothetical protein